MVQHNIAEPSNSAWRSPCLLADKANGEDHFCTDFRKVNSVTKPDCSQFPGWRIVWIVLGCQVCDEVRLAEGLLAGPFE